MSIAIVMLIAIHTYLPVQVNLCTYIRIVLCLVCDAVCGGILRCVAVCCSVLQCDAVCCSVMQCVAECCSVYVYTQCKTRNAYLYTNICTCTM